MTHVVWWPLLQVDIPVHIHNADSALITFTGVGYDKRILGDTMKVSDEPEQSGVPSVQSVSLPGQVRVHEGAYLDLFKLQEL